MRTKSTQFMQARHPVFMSLLAFVSGIFSNLAVGLGAPTSTNEIEGIGPHNIAIVVNDEDPLSEKIATYYQQHRNIPSANMIHVRFKPGIRVMSRAEFAAIKAQVDARTPRSVQAYALTWAAPYRVDCMSITTAFAAGFNRAYCASGCQPTRYNPYFDSDSRAPYSDFKIRPTMALAGPTFESVKRLIDRGVASDGTFPRGTGYLLSTSDAVRNVRADMYQTAVHTLGNRVTLHIVHADYIAHESDVLFYFTGVANVRELRTNHFLPGAIADHLTSDGGQLIDSDQMSSLAWIQAGATGSYGAVLEPCNMTDKFPDPEIVIRQYLSGETLIEAYWKSVAMPGQGIFVGEPLAEPYGRH